MEYGKSLVIALLFIFIISAVFMAYIWYQKPKVEKFEDETEVKELEQPKPPSKSDTEVDTEKEIAKNLEKNLFIINSYEEIYNKKISPQDLSKLTENLKDIEDKQIIKDKIKSFVSENFSPSSSATTSPEVLKELKDISEKLAQVVKKLDVTDYKETFVVSPFSTNRKYMLI